MQSVRTARSARSASRRKASRSPAVRYFRSPSAVCSAMPTCRGAGALGLRAGVTGFRADPAGLGRATWAPVRLEARTFRPEAG
jgi:hypothetical protein